MPSAKPRIAYNFRGVTMPTASHPAIRRLKRQGHSPSIHGNKLWKSSFLLIDYLNKHRPEHAARVMDAGCGWGIGGIWCAKALGSEVTSVDADDGVFPFLEASAELNGVNTTALCKRFEKITTAELKAYDMLIAADVCFWDELIAPVSNLINRAVRAGVKKIVIADPERSPFFEVADRAIDRHCGELLDWRTHNPVSASGALLVIENA